MLWLKAALLIRITRAKATRTASPGNHRSPASLRNCFGKWNARLCASTNDLFKLRFIGKSSVLISGVSINRPKSGRSLLLHRVTKSRLRVRWFRRFKRDQQEISIAKLLPFFHATSYYLSSRSYDLAIERVSIVEISGWSGGRLRKTSKEDFIWRGTKEVVMTFEKRFSRRISLNSEKKTTNEMKVLRRSVCACTRSDKHLPGKPMNSIFTKFHYFSYRIDDWYVIFQEPSINFDGTR